MICSHSFTGGPALGGADFNFVPMTPSIEPGAVEGQEGLAGASPLMTWGDIDGTPLILDPGATPLLDPSHGMFQLPACPAQEKVHNTQLATLDTWMAFLIDMMPQAAHALERDQRRRRAIRKSTPGASLHRDHSKSATPTPSPFGASKSSKSATPLSTPSVGGCAPSHGSSNSHKRGAKRARKASDLTPAVSLTWKNGHNLTSFPRHKVSPNVCTVDLIQEKIACLVIAPVYG